MRLLVVFLLAFSLVWLSGCGSMRKGREASAPEEQAVTVKPQQPGGGRSTALSRMAATAPRAVMHMDSAGGGGGGDRSGGGGGGRTDRGSISDDASAVSLASIGTVYAAGEPIDRKIIRNADLTLETETPTDGLRKITSVAESHGGFVVTSEFKQNSVAAGAKPSQSVTVVARVPASQFALALEQIRTAGDRVIQEKVSGQDVSEEYLDVEARLRNKKALEAQFLDIMKQAHKVEDALDVQTQLADVRTEIERLEGRRRFLENQAALSTITITLQMPLPIVATTTTGFGTTIKHAFGDAVDTAAAIILFVIQAVIVLVPIAVFFGMPGWFLWRVLRRRVFVRRPPEPSPIPSE